MPFLCVPFCPWGPSPTPARETGRELWAIQRDQVESTQQTVDGPFPVKTIAVVRGSAIAEVVTY